MEDQVVETNETQQTAKKEVSKEEIDKLVKHHVWAAMGVGLVPVPMLDMAALLAVQLNMLRKIGNAYSIPFNKDKVKNILASLLGSAVPTAVGPPLAMSILKTIPLVGMTVGAITMPVVSGASTYAIGKVFVQHFASGGTFLNFDPEKTKAYYAEMLKEGKENIEGSAQDIKSFASDAKKEDE
jgi:uncharacterized protein (DUF697 family)